MKTALRAGEAEAIVGALRRIGRELRASSGVKGLSGAQVFVLARLGEGKGRSVGELASLAQTDPSSTSVVVKRLVEARLAVRERSAEDERRVTIAITQAGRSALRKARTESADRLLDAVRDLPAAKQTTLARLLDEVVLSLDEDGRSSKTVPATPRKVGASEETRSAKRHAPARSPKRRPRRVAVTVRASSARP